MPMTPTTSTGASTGSPPLDVLLSLAGIQPGPGDHPAMVAAFEQARVQTDLIHGVAAARYEQPALLFSADL